MEKDVEIITPPNHAFFNIFNLTSIIPDWDVNSAVYLSASPLIQWRLLAIRNPLCKSRSKMKAGRV